VLTHLQYHLPWPTSDRWSSTTDRSCSKSEPQRAREISAETRWVTRGHPPPARCPPACPKNPAAPPPHTRPSPGAFARSAQKRKENKSKKQQPTAQTWPFQADQTARRPPPELVLATDASAFPTVGHHGRRSQAITVGATPTVPKIQLRTSPVSDDLTAPEHHSI
jgi:hypothetical protein